MARIAIIEDDVYVAGVIKEVGQELGHTVVSYFQPSIDSVVHLKEYAPNLIILDLRFESTVTGWDIIAAIKDDVSTRHIPVIVCSGARDQIDAQRRLLERYNIEVMDKPFDVQELSNMVERALGSEEEPNVRPAAGASMNGGS